MNLGKLIVYGLLAIVTLAGVVSTVWMLVPDSSAATNFLGGKTHCPFVPYSTYGSVAVAFFGAVVLLIARRFWR